MPVQNQYRESVMNRAKKLEEKIDKILELILSDACKVNSPQFDRLWSWYSELAFRLFVIEQNKKNRFLKLKTQQAA